MPKYYCDYCDSFLTHDSPSVRKTHNDGRKHKDNVRGFYQKWMEQQAQKLVDQTARAFAPNRMAGAVPRTTIGMNAPPMQHQMMGAPPTMPMMAPFPPIGFQMPRGFAPMPPMMAPRGPPPPQPFRQM